MEVVNAVVQLLIEGKPRLLWSPWHQLLRNWLTTYLCATFLSVVFGIMKCLVHLFNSDPNTCNCIFYKSLYPFWFLDFSLVVMALKYPWKWVTAYFVIIQNVIPLRVKDLRTLWLVSAMTATGSPGFSVPHCFHSTYLTRLLNLLKLTSLSGKITNPVVSNKTWMLTSVRNCLGQLKYLEQLLRWCTNKKLYPLKDLGKRMYKLCVCVYWERALPSLVFFSWILCSHYDPHRL